MMAAATISACFPALKGADHGLSFAKAVDFTKIASEPNSEKKPRRFKSKALVIRNSSSGSETIELQPASEGSPLLGIIFFSYSMIPLEKDNHCHILACRCSIKCFPEKFRGSHFYMEI